MCVCACVSVRVNPKTFSTCQLVVTEGKGDLGVTSYLTDADGNVIIGCKSRPTTPTERRKSVTGKKMQKRKDSVILQKPPEEKEGKKKMEDKTDALPKTIDKKKAAPAVASRVGKQETLQQPTTTADEAKPDDVPTSEKPTEKPQINKGKNDQDE